MVKTQRKLIDRNCLVVRKAWGKGWLGGYSVIFTGRYVSAMKVSFAWENFPERNAIVIFGNIVPENGSKHKIP